MFVFRQFAEVRLRLGNRPLEWFPDPIKSLEFAEEVEVARALL
jgi:hypothetical protein